MHNDPYCKANITKQTCLHERHGATVTITRSMLAFALVASRYFQRFMRFSPAPTIWNAMKQSLQNASEHGRHWTSAVSQQIMQATRIVLHFLRIMIPSQSSIPKENGFVQQTESKRVLCQ